MNASRIDTLLESITEEEKRLASLEEARTVARSRIDSLKAELSAASSEPQIRVRLPLTLFADAPTTPAGKIALFRRLFRGRNDVFPKLWTNKRTGKKGYAPACDNEWEAGICEKPRVKCGECPSQAFIPVADKVILKHLQGRHTIGVYPMLEDETCWLLAVDFDKSSWAEDVAAFTETCRKVGLPYALERSRSGNGAHVWFFFSAPVQASTARRMGCYLLTETMSRRHELGMDSYDRLFPSQDTMPRGGFGNLIALPLQFGPRNEGNTVFLDDHLRPHEDQWAFLASLASIEPATVEQVAREATRSGSVLGVRHTEAIEDEDAPWTRLPSGRPKPARITEPLPPRVAAVLSQRLFVEKAALPSALVNQIKRLAAFQNPDFYKKQSMRLSTNVTPRVIACAEDLPQYVGLPRATRGALEELFREHSIALDIDDQRVDGKPVEFTFRETLSPVQERAARALLATETGVFVAPPGVGKTVVGIYLVAARARSTLILVHRTPLLDQWIAQLAMFLGIDPKEIGQIGAGKNKPNGKLDVAMIQSLVRKGGVSDLVAGYGQVIVDECHHLPAVSFERVLSEVKARYVVGLTATPQRRDGHHPITEMQLGPVAFEIDAKSQAAKRPFEHRLIVRETSFASRQTGDTVQIQELYGELARDEDRNRLILDDVIRSLEDGHSPILLTERTDHLEYFEANLRKLTKHLVVLRGGMTVKARRAVRDQLASIPADAERLVLATGRYIGEGFDDARLDTLFLAMPISWKGTLIQYAGRLHRLHPKKTTVRIFDYVDRSVPMLLRMFEKRLRGYRAIGYARGEAPLGLDEPREVVTEYDDGLEAVPDDL